VKLHPITFTSGDVRFLYPGLKLRTDNPDELLVIRRIDSATQIVYAERVTLPARRHWLFGMLRRLFQ
jgi:hypothetical protein